MGRTLRQCRITLRRVLPQFESVKSFPACLRLDRSHSSFPYSPGRGPTLPICYFPVCASASCLLPAGYGKQISHIDAESQRMIVHIKRNSPCPAPAFSVSLCLLRRVTNFYYPAKLSLVLFIADLFHPVDGFAVKMFQDGDVPHCRS